MYIFYYLALLYMVLKLDENLDYLLNIKKQKMSHLYFLLLKEMFYKII